MRPTHPYVALIALAVSAVALLRAAAGEACCTHCGCHCQCRKVCRLVREEKKVDIICWGCKCEYFCIAGPSTPNCEHSEEACGTGDEACDPTMPRAKPKKFIWTDWIPGCAKVHVKKKLMQKTVTKKVPSYMWVVEDLCPTCRATQAAILVKPGANVPEPPDGFEPLEFRITSAEVAAEESNSIAHSPPQP